jgi:hypothetical protein
MEATPRRVLVVLNRPVSTHALAHAVRRRAAHGDCAFTLLVPAVAHGFHRVVDPEDACCEEAERTIRGLLPALEQAAGAPVGARIGAHEVLAAIEDAVNDGGYDEVMFATAAHRIERLLRVDLPRKVAALGVEVRAAA